jgi:myo-inositol 2-dehydrogenase / D-chiro-inositol 1-dehydrogenase
MTQAIGIIGGGRIAERHVAAYKHVGDVRLTIADVDRSVAERRGDVWGIEVAPDPWALIEDPGLDAIDVCAPTMFHAQYAIAALSAGKHVFCEKPLCTTMEEAEEIRAAAYRSGKIAMTGYLYRFYPAFEFVKDILDQQVIGEPYMALIRVGGRGGTAAWKHQDPHGGGAVSEMMVHMLDLAAWYFGPIEDLDLLWQTTLLPERTVAGETVRVSTEDFSVVRLEAGPVQILLESDLATPSYMQHIDIQGDNGSIFSSILHYLPTVVYCKEGRGIYDQGNNMYTFPQVNVFERELKHFLEIIKVGKKPGRNGLEDAIHIVELVERLRSQVASGR